MKPNIAVIIPTFNNPEYLTPCIRSIASSGALNGLCELVVVNNGKQPIQDLVKGWPNTRVLEPGRNLGWEGGLKYGLDNTDTEFVCFQNDDTIIPKATQLFYQNLLWPFQDSNVAAVGPATTIASGWHSIYRQDALRRLTEVSYLIFFTVMVRRKDLDAVGGIDTSCPGGDDFDLSIRLRKAGKHLLINPDAFLIHHAFKTGTRVRGDQNTPGGWNSKEMIDRTNHWLIQKHGFKTFMGTMRGLTHANEQPPRDLEGETVAQMVSGEKVYELGCGYRKTVQHAIGLDTTKKGELCGHLDGYSVADIVADVTQKLPIDDLSADTVIARHILEHCINPVATLRHWNRVLKLGGNLVIAVPDHSRRNTIPLNPEHVHGYTREGLKDLLELCGFKQTAFNDPCNGVSFVASFEKVLHMVKETNGAKLETVNA